MMKKIAAMILCLSLCLTFCACGAAKEPAEKIDMAVQAGQEETDGFNGTLYDTFVEEADVTQPTEAGADLSRNVTITDITFQAVEAYSASTDLRTRQGYMIQATVRNGNDVSVDVFPAFSAVYTDSDNYGDPRERKVLLMNSGCITTPYGPDYLAMYVSDGYLRPVGLAPHETKTVRYYIIGEGVYVLPAAEIGADGAVNFFNRVDILLDGNNALSGLELCGLKAAEAEQVYLAAEDWAGDFRMLRVDESMTGLRMIRHYLQGTFTNTTDERWESVNVQFDITVDGQATYESVRHYANLEYSYVDIGDVIDIANGSETGIKVAGYEHGDFDVEMVPGLLAYTPDPNY